MGAPGNEPAGPDIQRYIAAVLRRKWVILLVTALGTGAGVLASRFVQLSYSASTTLWVDIGSDAESGPIRDSQLLESTAWVQLVRSGTVLDPAVRDRRLFLNHPGPEDAPVLSTLLFQDTFQTGSFTLQVSGDGSSFSLLNEQGVEVQRGKPGDPIGPSLGMIWQPAATELRPGRKIPFTIQNPHDVARSLGDRLTTQMAEESSFLTVTLEGSEPNGIAATLNAIAERYVQVAAELKRAKLVELTDILDEQLRYAQERLSAAEISLEEFRVQTITLPSQAASPVAAGLAMTRDPVLDNYFELNIRREELRSGREAIERILREAEISPSALDGLAGIDTGPQGAELQQALNTRNLKRAELHALEQRYLPDWAPLRQLSAEIESLERQQIPQLARNLIASLASEENAAEMRIRSAGNELQEIPPRAIEEARLDRQVAIAENLHSELKQRYEVARLAAAGAVPDIRILDRAVEPNMPDGDRRLLLIALGVLGGLGLSVFGAILSDRIDPRVRYPEQLTNEMGLPIIGMVPHLAGNGDSRDASNLAAVSEAFREIRLSLLYAYGAAGPVSFTVTSPEAGDGKSFVTSNLALAFGQQGYRTLVIDGDIRRGRLAAALGVDRSPGLTDYLAGKVGLEDIIQTTSHPHVSVIGSGTRMEMGPELLGSSMMASLTRGMRQRYDVIMVDSPPLGAGVDPYILGTVTGNLLLVFRTGNTNRAFAQAKLKLVDRLPIRLLGSVLNGIPSNQKMYKYYSYLPDYMVQREEDVTWTEQKVPTPGSKDSEAVEDYLPPLAAGGRIARG